MAPISALTNTAARDVIRERVVSREWWVFPWTSSVSSQLSVRVEELYYAGDANADFEAYLLQMPLGVFALTMGKKSRMSPSQLAACIAGLGILPEANALDDLIARLSDPARDLVYLIPEDELPASGDPRDNPVSLAFRDFLLGDDDWTPPAAHPDQTVPSVAIDMP